MHEFKWWIEYNFKHNSMSYSNLSKWESRSRRSTEEDISSEGEDYLYPKTNPNKHKTELCKTFSELGFCPYLHKCRFAHGKEELVQVPAKVVLKNRKCNGFWKNGVCSYGSRCQFGHAEIGWETRAVLSGFAAACGSVSKRKSGLMTTLFK